MRCWEQEWRPDFEGFGNRVALLQLASARTALLVRTCRMRFKLPPALVAFLRRVCMAPCVWLSDTDIDYHRDGHRNAIAALLNGVALCVVHGLACTMLML